MWSRAQLKGRAKATFKRNYWKCILISLLLTLIAGGSGAASGNLSSATGSLHGSDNQAGSSYDYDSSYDSDDGSLRDFEAGLEEGFKDGLKAGNRGMMGGMVAAAIAIGILIVVFLVIFVLILLVDVFIINPLEVGCRRFFIRNLNEPAQIGNIGYGFDNNYRNVAKTMFFRDLFTVLWSLLFIIPGIVKAYEYMMIPYLLAEPADDQRAGICGKQAYDAGTEMESICFGSVLYRMVHFIRTDTWNSCNFLCVTICECNTCRTV